MNTAESLNGASAQIRTQLEQEQLERIRRGVVVAFGFAILAVIPPVVGLRPPSPIAMVAHLFAVFGVATGLIAASVARVRVPRPWSAVLIGFFVLSPLVAAETLFHSAAVDFGAKGFGCGLWVAVQALAAFLLAWVVFGRLRRRFGSAPYMLGTAAAMVGAFGWGLHCPAASLAHLVHHVWGAALVAISLPYLLGRWSRL